MIVCKHCGVTERQIEKQNLACIHGKAAHEFEQLPEPGTESAELIPNVETASLSPRIERPSSDPLNWQPSHEPKPVNAMPCDVMPDKRVSEKRLDAYIQAALAGVDPIATNRPGYSHARLAVETAIEALNLADRIIKEQDQ